MISAEEVMKWGTVIIGGGGALISFILFLRKTFKAVDLFTKEQEVIKQAVTDIKAEVTHNGGKSIKDVVTGLKSTAERIETRQKILDQRSKAALHYNQRALFEVEKSGRITWVNEEFQKLTRENGELEGYDWFSIVHEDHREAFIKEVRSCLRMCRKIDIETVSVKGRVIHFQGYPYKTGSYEHEGFLIHVFCQNNCAGLLKEKNDE